jgi:hypothetical protein
MGTKSHGNRGRTTRNDLILLGVLLSIYGHTREFTTAHSPPTPPRTIQQVSVKLLNGTVIKVTAEPTDTVQTLKERVEATNSELAVGT